MTPERAPHERQPTIQPAPVTEPKGILNPFAPAPQPHYLPCSASARGALEVNLPSWPDTVHWHPATIARMIELGWMSRDGDTLTITDATLGTARYTLGDAKGPAQLRSSTRR